ncbi:MAG: ion transporter [Bacteroidales bacterium]|nr:ion transporter [Bacteroidales bacterium]MBN2755811.1 ion transporter [Bacteroidales bacterium]
MTDIKSFTKLFLNDRFILFLIILNSFTIFSEGFPELGTSALLLINTIDSLITILFLIEAVTKINYFGWKNYYSSNWNKLDLILVILSIPSIFLLIIQSQNHGLSFLLIFRISRVFKFFRFFKFIPGIDILMKGVQRALKASIFVLFGFFILNFIIAILTCYIFKDVSPHFFGNPLKSMYTIFKIFTVEGWYEIPDALSKNTGHIQSALIKIYFVIILILGGIMGLSLVNSIFVDSMVMDNNDELEKKIDLLNQKIDSLIENQHKKRI